MRIYNTFERCLSERGGERKCNIGYNIGAYITSKDVKWTTFADRLTVLDKTVNCRLFASDRILCYIDDRRSQLVRICKTNDCQSRGKY